MNQCTLAAAAAVVNKGAYRTAMALFPDLPFKKAVEDLLSKEAGSGDLNFTALNVVGWLVFSSGVTLRPGFQEAIKKKAGAGSWMDATFAGFSDTAKVAGASSGRKIAKDRRDAFGVDAIAKVVEEVKSAIIA